MPRLLLLYTKDVILSFTRSTGCCSYFNWAKVVVVIGFFIIFAIGIVASKSYFSKVPKGVADSSSESGSSSGRLVIVVFLTIVIFLCYFDVIYYCYLVDVDFVFEASDMLYYRFILPFALASEG